MSFIGLPTPAAAGVIVSLVIFHQETLPILSETNPALCSVLEDVVFYCLPVLALGLAVLMVSRIRYPHVLNQYIRGRKPFAQFIRVLLGLGLIIWSRQAALVLIFCGFAASGFLKWFYYRVLKKGPLLVSAESVGLCTPQGQVFENDEGG
jgi:CDP-diacylglycerol--serine O-phosphatidyltransferase